MRARWPISSMLWEICVIIKDRIPYHEEMAARWHARRADRSDARVEQDLQRWLDASEDNRAAYSRICDGAQNMQALGEAPEILSLRHQTLARLAVRRRSQAKPEALLGIILAMLMVGTPVYGLYRWSAPQLAAENG